jgi:hypothetical protein
MELLAERGINVSTARCCAGSKHWGRTVLGVFVPQVFAAGYPAVDGALWGTMGLHVLTILVVAKIVAVSVHDRLRWSVRAVVL